MSIHQAANAAIQQRLADNYSTTDIAYDNQDFDPPDTDAWVRLVVLFGDAAQVGMGLKRSFRYTGVINIEIFSKQDQVTKEAYDIADELSALFRGVQFSGITCRTPSAVSQGVQNGWFKLGFNVDFWIDDTET